MHYCVAYLYEKWPSNSLKTHKRMKKTKTYVYINEHTRWLSNSAPLI